MNDRALASSEAKGKPRLLSLSGGAWRTIIGRHQTVALVCLFVISTFLALRTDTFLTWNNLSNIARQFSWIGIAAFGESMVIIIGGIDLSVGAVMALGGLIGAWCLGVGVPVPLAAAAGVLSGGLIGWLNGTLVGRVRLPPFIVTLGTMRIARGIAFGLTGGWPVRKLPEAFRALGQDDLVLGGLSLPLPFVFTLGLALLVSLLMSKTVLGSYIYTLASSERALLTSGVNVVQLKTLVYTLCGVLAATGGLLMTARLGVAAPTAADGYELDIIAAAIIGGTSLLGGRGSTLGVLVGAAVMQVLRNGLVLLEFSTNWLTAVLGAVTLAFIMLDHRRRRRQSRGGL